MNNKKVILVTGATGLRGGAVARALLRQNKFRVRILTRNPRSYKALLLQRAGAEIAVGDYADKQSLIRAMQDSYGVFGVTGFGETPEKEYAWGMNLIDAVQLTGIRHFILLTQPNYHKISHGRFAVPGHDVKAKLEQYARRLSLPASFVQPAFYYEYFLDLFAPQKDHKGGYYFGFPQGETKMAAASVEDLGNIVTAVFDHPEEHMGQVIPVVGSNLSPDEYAAVLSRALNKNIYYTYVPRNIYAAYDFPGAEDWANYFEVQRLHLPGREQELLESYRLNPWMQPFESWVQKNRDQFLSYFNSLFEAVVI